MALLITGCAGFIGSHLASFLLDRGERVIGIDNLNPYYDVALKHARLARLQANSQFTFHQIDIADEAAVTDLFAGYSDISAILHLAAQAGVRYSLSNPLVYGTWVRIQAETGRSEWTSSGEILLSLAERVGFEPTCRNYPTIRFRVGAVMTTSVPLQSPFRGLNGPQNPLARTGHYIMA